MPVILEAPQWAPFLGETGATADAYEMLKPCAEDIVKYHPVGKAVGNVRNHGAELAAGIQLVA